jgi:adenylosuccinate synthase
MNISIVVGLGYGDEGKGATVNALCTDPKRNAVVRFNGGHQVGHTVVHGSNRHPFSNFGSGTLKGVPTYWSEYCTVNPMAVLKEGNVLRTMGVHPVVIYNANAMVTTPYDILQNLSNTANLNHGSVGVGFGKTIKRNEDMYHLYVRDLLCPDIRDEKLKLIKKYYFDKSGDIRLAGNTMNELIDEFTTACYHLVVNYKIVNSFQEAKLWDKDLIFEGGQGIMLDMDYGFFPHVTYSNTTSKNAFELLSKWGIDYHVRTYYVTRAYQTRHGNGPMVNEGKQDISYIKINPLETNVDTGTQGVFRRAMLDIPQLRYAVSCDGYHNSYGTKNLVITCYDHVGEMWIMATDINGKVQSYSPEQLANKLDIFDVYTSNSDKGFAL